MLTFYAELLPNIKSISLLISLPTPANASTRATVDPGSTTAVLYHHGETTPLILPAQANPGPRQLVLTTTLGEKTLSSRLPLAAPSTTASYDNENYAPWSALQLSSKESVSYCCRACKAVVLPSGRIQKWKNLPSGNWADMMDFWHCHKPHDHDKEKANKESNGGGRYSTFGQGFAVEQGVGLVDRGYFLFSSKDCDSVQIVDEKVTCSSCNSILGAPERGVSSEDSLLWRLNKWNLSLNEKESHPLECFLSAQFISYAEEGGVRRLLVTNENNTQVTGLKVWVFNPDIRYTHSQESKPVRGIKVFWQAVKKGEHVPTDSLKATGFEAVELDAKAFETLKRCLDESNSALPVGIRQSGEWNVGAIRRFEDTT
ncbi:ubiquitin-conjugating enzyme E2-binding protein [Pyronema omphalodes]|nr:ubiquitin-conjugating enzyme E2-binding protein [Pyronema omphalodes]